jgi:Thiamine pyrophosphate enzyme, N-terminal TPP binding domain
LRCIKNGLQNFVQVSFLPSLKERGEDRMAEISGGEVIARMLQKEGVDKVFGIIDGTYFGFYSALHRLGIEIVTPRHETSAAHMAGAYARLTGKARRVHGHGLILIFSFFDGLELGNLADDADLIETLVASIITDKIRRSVGCGVQHRRVREAEARQS